MSMFLAALLGFCAGGLIVHAWHKYLVLPAMFKLLIDAGVDVETPPKVLRQIDRLERPSRSREPRA